LRRTMAVSASKESRPLSGFEDRGCASMGLLLGAIRSVAISRPPGRGPKNGVTCSAACRGVLAHGVVADREPKPYLFEGPFTVSSPHVRGSMGLTPECWSGTDCRAGSIEPSEQQENHNESPRP
jgi:hypothetical protein